MKAALYLALAAGVLFDVVAGTYLWQLLSEPKPLSVVAGTDQGKTRKASRKTDLLPAPPTPYSRN